MFLFFSFLQVNLSVEWQLVFDFEFECLRWIYSNSKFSNAITIDMCVLTTVGLLITMKPCRLLLLYPISYFKLF